MKYDLIDIENANLSLNWNYIRTQKPKLLQKLLQILYFKIKNNLQTQLILL